MGAEGRGTETACPRRTRPAGAADQLEPSSSDVESDIGGGSPGSDSKSPSTYLSSQWFTAVEKLPRPDTRPPPCRVAAFRFWGEEGPPVAAPPRPPEAPLPVELLGSLVGESRAEVKRGLGWGPEAATPEKGATPAWLGRGFPLESEGGEGGRKTVADGGDRPGGGVGWGGLREYF